MRLSELEGIGPVRLETLRAMGIVSLRDLLFMLPVRYEDHHTVFPCSVKVPGNIMVCGVFPEGLKNSYFHGISRVSGTISDGTGKMPVCWYNEPWIIKQIIPGQQVRLYGKLNIKNGKRTLQNPKIVTDDGWIPVYRAMKGFPAKSFRNLITQALDHLEDCCPETLPADFRIRNHLCELNFALREAHFPGSMTNLGIARRRLAFERILIYLLYVSIAGKMRAEALPMRFPSGAEDRYWNSLPFEPTPSQRKVLKDAAADMQGNQAMARLIQGDVGSGKTAVAFGSMFLAKEAGFQSSMMAPTEILASQHYLNALNILGQLGMKCRLLTGSTKAKERKEILKELEEGTCDALFGTHALISRDVRFAKLGLVITDEQHRFGVNQRTALQDKGTASTSASPHVMVMSATPIPRSLALILYGDLDISVISELPKGRKAVKTRIVPEAKREDMYGFLKQEASKGRQAYIVCPAVEDSETSDEMRSAKAVFSSLRETCLKNLKIGLTWGGQKSAEKEQVLQDYRDGKYDLLVSTTVIEVGINNPNATVMVIENAERFGLSQLHQLRGRVGRGSEESWCFLLSEHSEKLDILCRSNDGFEISKKDLELRGPGDLLGTRQSGIGIGSLFPYEDSRLLEEVSEAVKKLRNTPEQADTLNALMRYAAAYFAESGHVISLN